MCRFRQQDAETFGKINHATLRFAKVSFLAKKFSGTTISSLEFNLRRRRLLELLAPAVHWIGLDIAIAKVYSVYYEGGQCPS